MPEYAVPLLIAGGTALLLDVLLFLPRRSATQTSAPTGGHGQPVLAKFLQSVAGCTSPGDLLAHTNQTMETVLSASVAATLLAFHEGAIALVAANSSYVKRDNEDDILVFSWLAQKEKLLRRGDLDGASDVGAQATRALMDTLGASLVLPLHHSRTLVGVVLIRCEADVGASALRFADALRVHLAAVLATLLLRTQSEDSRDVSGILRKASLLQTSLMPEEIVHSREGECWELQGLSRPVAACGGDFWAWYRIAENRIVVVVGDATGHGAGPALLSAVTKGALDAHVQVKGGATDPGRLLFALNKAVLRTGRRNVMMTAFAILVDTAKCEIRFANAGHNFPYLIRDGELEVLVARGDQLGVGETPVFRTHTKTITEGERIVLYSDGITEAGQEFGEEYGERRFRRLLKQAKDEPVAVLPLLLLSAAKEHVAKTPGASIQDDVTVVAIDFTVAKGAK